MSKEAAVKSCWGGEGVGAGKIKEVEFGGGARRTGFIFVHTLLANISKKCHKKVVFMKNN